MSIIQLKNETEKIYKEFGAKEKSSLLLCPILRILEMRHKSLDIVHAKKIVIEYLKN